MICNLCPRRCNALRTDTEGAGYCGMPGRPAAARAALHHWEEPPISGTRGSGAVFFSGCPLGCVFCQNSQISRGRFGAPVTTERLRQLCDGLIAQGAHNLNFVTPTHYAHVLGDLLEERFPVPVVWNTGGYERVETLRALAGKVDIYLPDLKYLDRAAAARYSAAPDYPEHAAAAIREMVGQTGPVQLDGEGILRRGVIIRHLLLPGQLAGAKAVMDWVAETFAPGEVLFSLMSQYVPLGNLEDYPEINRPLRRAEARKAAEYMALLGLEGFTQELGAADAQYVPEFDLTGIV
jgi:putative pyruvate formate lyase activating enzyme